MTQLRVMQKLFFEVKDHLMEAFNPDGKDLQSVYDDFVHEVLHLCVSLETDHFSTYFSYCYTRQELQQLKLTVNTLGAEKKHTHSILHW